MGLVREARRTQIVLAAGILPAIGVLAWLSITFSAGLDWSRLFFWIGITLAAAALPVRLPNDVRAHLTTAPILAALFDSSLPNPFAACWVAAVGTLEIRDLRRQLPWYGTLFNKASYVLAAFAAGALFDVTRRFARPDDPVGTVIQIFVVGGTFALVNNALTLVMSSARTNAPLARVFMLTIQNMTVGIVSQIPMGWLMAEIALKVGTWATLLLMVPLLLARFSFSRYTETRELFFGSVSALSQAIDAKDGFTRGHADRVSRIAGALAREMGVSEKQIEQIELAGLLHDIGKIGVEDRILMKPARLDDEERELMKRHTVYGASILEPSTALRPLVPIVLHHHENYDGSGYPEGLKGEEIPLGSRILIVADAYEAMTSDRVYRKAIGHERAMEQLSKYKGIQFDPRVVRTLDQLLRKRGPSAFEVSDLPSINYETLADVRKRLAHEPASGSAHAD